MIIMISLVVVLIIGYVLFLKDKEESILGLILIVVSGLSILIGASCLLTKGYDYEKFVAKRTAFQQTLQQVRQSNRTLESAAIISKIAEWNSELASYKYDRTVLLLKDFVDERIDTLQPIQ